MNNFHFIPPFDAQDLVKNECDEWSKKGINIRYETRKDRAGYKAGNLKEGMKHSYVECCEYVAMFDADFQPEPDFLMKTIPFLVHNPKLALVQSRWKFGTLFVIIIALYPCRSNVHESAFLCIRTEL